MAVRVLSRFVANLSPHYFVTFTPGYPDLLFASSNGIDNARTLAVPADHPLAWPFLSRCPNGFTSTRLARCALLALNEAMVIPDEVAA